MTGRKKELGGRNLWRKELVQCFFLGDGDGNVLKLGSGNSCTT